MMRRIFCILLLLFLLISVAFSLLASPVTEATTDLKGFFGESLADDIYQNAGRTIVPFKMDPNINGPDKIYRLANGMLEVHEVKAYSGWAGKAAMKTTASKVPTHELSSRWCENWIRETLSSSTASNTEKSAASALADAIKHKKVKFIFDEFNLTTEQFRASEVLQIGIDDVSLVETMGPTKLKNFDKFFSQKTKDFQRLKMGNLEKVMKSPKTNASWQLLSKKDQLALIPEDLRQNANVGKETVIRNGLMTQDGRLLVSIKSGLTSGFMVFATDSSHAVYQYLGGNILKPELERNIADAAARGTFVGSCVGVTVFLGATPSGWVVLAVSIGSYFVIDSALQVWHEHQDRKHLTVDDLRGWGISLDTPLAPPKDSILKPKTDSILAPENDTILF